MEGEFKANEPHGYLFIKYLDHESLESVEGQYLNGNSHGFKITKYKDGSSNYGEYVDDQ